MARGAGFRPAPPWLPCSPAPPCPRSSSRHAGPRVAAPQARFSPRRLPPAAAAAIPLRERARGPAPATPARGRPRAFWSLPPRAGSGDVIAVRPAGAARPWRSSASTGTAGPGRAAGPGRSGRGRLEPEGLCLVRFRYGGEEEQEENGAEAEERARVLLERLRQQARSRQLKKQREARPAGGEGELPGGAGPGEGKRKRESGEQRGAQGQKKPQKERQPRSAPAERADTGEAAGGSAPSRRRKENRRKAKAPQEGTETGNDRLGLFYSTVLSRSRGRLPFG